MQSCGICKTRFLFWAIFRRKGILRIATPLSALYVLPEGLAA